MSRCGRSGLRPSTSLTTRGRRRTYRASKSSSPSEARGTSGVFGAPVYRKDVVPRDECPLPSKRSSSRRTRSHGRSWESGPSVMRVSAASWGRRATGSRIPRGGGRSAGDSQSSRAPAGCARASLTRSTSSWTSPRRNSTRGSSPTSSSDPRWTRWPCRRCQGKGCDHCGGKGKMYDTSVEEEVAAPLMAQTGGSGHALHGMGREDVDARMLGRGRPFIVEIKEPARRTVDLPAVEGAVNRSGTVEVSGLRPASGQEVVSLKEDRARKTYRVLVRFATLVEDGKLKGGVSSLVGRPIAQRTPLRVSHRRADRTRERLVASIEVSRSEGTTGELRGTAEAGAA